MFALNKYAEKIYEIKWKFNVDIQKDYEDLLFVEFEQKENGYFYIKNVMYTFVDILVGLETLDFVVSKVKNDIILEIISD